MSKGRFLTYCDSKDVVRKANPLIISSIYIQVFEKKIKRKYNYGIHINLDVLV